jgi:hypothetical protein
VFAYIPFPDLVIYLKLVSMHRKVFCCPMYNISRAIILKKKNISPFSTHHIINNFLAAVVLSTRHFVSTTTPSLYA